MKKNNDNKIIRIWSSKTKGSDFIVGKSNVIVLISEFKVLFCKHKNKNTKTNESLREWLNIMFFFDDLYSLSTHSIKIYNNEEEKHVL